MGKFRGAGDLDRRVVFDKPMEANDVEDGWSEQFTCHAHFRYLRGGEAVQAARLEGRQPVVLTIHASKAAKEVTTDWRMRDLRAEAYDSDGDLTAGVYAVTAPPVLSDDRLWLEITCTSGVAA